MSSTRSTSFKTDGLRLRKLEAKDAPYMLEWMHDPETSRLFRANFAAFTEQDALRFIEGAQTDGANLHRACVDAADEYLGTVSLKNINHENADAEYAISFRKCARGTGAARFATQEILKTAFEELGLRRVYLNVLTDNVRANAFYKKCGFVFERCERGAVEVGGVLRDLNWYGMEKK